MGAPYIKQFDIFSNSKACLSTANVIGNDPHASAANSKITGSPRHPLPSTLTLRLCSSRERGLANLRLTSPLLLRSEGDANKRTSNRRWSHVCNGTSAKVEGYDYDLYELLGIEKDAQFDEIKRAYRWLQKRCHPDIAGPRGHDMAILLNDAYSILSDPNRRASYDMTCAENKDFAGYTGNPLYSTWYGGPAEDRAVFVEETRCIGCLKCALIAPNTFAIESKFGRARCQNQWLDGDNTIQDAIGACPVDCISWVNKDSLPALEFIMSKQPRILATIRNSNYVGVRQENVFAGAEKFLKKYAKWEEAKASSSQETAAQRAARMAAADAIHIKSGQWWRNVMPFGNLTFGNLWDSNTTRVSQGALIPISSVRPVGKNQSVDKKWSEKYHSEREADLEPLFEAVRQQRRRSKLSAKVGSSSALNDDEYWTPMEPITCPLPERNVEKSTPASKEESSSSTSVYDPALDLWSMVGIGKAKHGENRVSGVEALISAVPIATAIVAAVVVGMNGGSDVARSETSGLITGPLPSSISSGVVMQMFLTAVVWYMIGVLLSAGAVLMTTAFVKLNEEKRKG